MSAKAQQPEDPEDEKQLGLWLDQGIAGKLNAVSLHSLRSGL
jgi:hypothetical protein